MKMFLRYFLLSLASMAIAAIAFIERVVVSVAEFLLAPFQSGKMWIATDGPALDRSIDRPSLSASLLESIRHEKGFPRFGAARNI